MKTNLEEQKESFISFAKFAKNYISSRKVEVAWEQWLVKQKPMVKVYISSPYSIGDVAVNVKRQIDASNELMDMGFVPFVPLYSHFQHMIHPRPYEDWIKVDLEWVRSCDCLLRLEGESKGADKEVKLANELNIPVYYSFEELYEAYNIEKDNVNSDYYSYNNPVYSRKEILDLIKECFPDKSLNGIYKISASKQIHDFETKLRELGKINSEKK